MESNSEFNHGLNKDEKHAYQRVIASGIFNLIFLLPILYNFLFMLLTYNRILKNTNMQSVMLTLGIQTLISSTILVLSAIGLFRKKTWGWWIAESYYLYVILSKILSVAAPFILKIEAVYSMSYIMAAVFPAIIWILTCTVLLVLLMNIEVRDMFKVPSALMKVVPILFGSACLLILANYTINYIAFRT